MEDEKIIVFYNNKKFKMTTLKKLLKKDRLMKDIKYIALPYIYKASYILVKPHEIFRSDKIILDIELRAVSLYDYNEIEIAYNESESLIINEEIESPLKALSKIFTIIKSAYFNLFMIDMLLEASQGIIIRHIFPTKMKIGYEINGEYKTIANDELYEDDLLKMSEEDFYLYDIYRGIQTLLKDIFIINFASDEKEIKEISFDFKKMSYKKDLKTMKDFDGDIYLKKNCIFGYYNLIGHEDYCKELLSPHYYVSIFIFTCDDADDEDYKTTIANLYNSPITDRKNDLYNIGNDYCLYGFEKSLGDTLFYDFIRDSDEIVQYIKFYMGDLAISDGLILMIENKVMDNAKIFINEEINFNNIRKFY